MILCASSLRDEDGTAEDADFRRLSSFAWNHLKRVFDLYFVVCILSRLRQTPDHHPPHTPPLTLLFNQIMGQRFSSPQEEAVLFAPSIQGNLDEVKKAVGAFIANQTGSGDEHVEALRGFVNRTDSAGNAAVHAAVFSDHLDIRESYVRVLPISYLYCISTFSRPRVYSHLLGRDVFCRFDNKEWRRMHSPLGGCRLRSCGMSGVSD